MKIVWACLVIVFINFSSLSLATDINGRFVIVNKENSIVSILLQFNTNTGTDDLGGSTIVIGFDNTLINITDNPQRNVDYYFHNFNGSNYSLGTITKPSENMVWVNIDLKFNNSNNGTILAKDPEWTDVVTINFELISSTDSIALNWLTTSTFWGIYDANNLTLWNTGTFIDMVGEINFDITPPLLLSAQLLDITTLELKFSEPLDSVSAVDMSNYSITNGINIQDVFISSYQDIVTLITDAHANGNTYIITCQNIYDVSGNNIDTENNSAQYICVNDTIPPIITEVQVINSRTISVKFSERLDHSSVSNKDNYAISNNIEINSVQVLPDSSSASLKTSRQDSDTEYILTVANIKDRLGNNISPNPSNRQYRTHKKGKGNSRQNVIQSAISNSWHQYFTPDKSIDGKGMIFPDSRWQSEETMPVSISFDLGEQLSFDSLRISFYKWESGRKFEYSVYTSKDSIIWEPNIEYIWSENFEWSELNLDSTKVRYMKLVLSDCNQGPFGSIWEVEMYGTDEVNSFEETSEVPEFFKLYQNYPNPFNPSTTISYQLPISSRVILKVYNILGKEIMTLVNEDQEPGHHKVNFEANNLASGIYIYKLRTTEFNETKKMILLR